MRKDEQTNCPSCDNDIGLEMASRPEPSIVAILMASIGGLLAFFGLFFGLVAAVAESAFLIVSLVTCAIAASLFVLAYVARRKQIGEWERREEKSLASARCDYCGSQNQKGESKCKSCGAPLNLQ